jgi:hypothetical protein
MEQFAWYEIVIGIIVFVAIIGGILVAFSVDKDEKSPKVSNDDPKECPNDDKSKYSDKFNKGYY